MKSKQLFPPHEPLLCCRCRCFVLIVCCCLRNLLSAITLIGIPPVAPVRQWHWFSIVPLVVFHLSSVLPVNCEGSRCFAPDSLVSCCRLFLIPRRPVKGTWSDFIYRLSVLSRLYTGVFGKRFFFVVVFLSVSSLCAHKCTLKSTLRIKTLLPNSPIWLEQLPDWFIHNNLSIDCWNATSSHL